MAVSGFRLRARLGFSIPSSHFGQRGITPAFGYGAPHLSAGGTSTLPIWALPSAHYERIRLGEEVENALAQKRARDEETILDRIRPLVHKTRTSKIVSDRMVVNAAFLVDRRNGVQVDDAVRGLHEEFSDRLIFKYFGPVPPYNFVNIVVNWAG